MKDTIISAESLNADAVQKEITVLVTLGLLGVAMLVSLYAAHVADMNDSLKEDFKNGTRSKASSLLSFSRLFKPTKKKS
eukprot:CAMPEP_0170110028 /NCGR_PEP_ID=MMETSP0020_2-20130122/7609_1 /TAXON_ID=98059 /ORGANISM="Dinobryon sp., Strain UTEXLB2267" /LENGTH=78 /DNA_ID=CAMNT_0010335235 /DNA_START=55 /DNA_END=287 /DNA_ORIENTATION=-